MLLVPFMLGACKGESKSSEEESTSNKTPIDFTNMGGGSSSNYSCPKCGFTYDPYDTDIVFLNDNGMCKNCYNKLHGSSSGNQYGEGYEQGQEDAKNGLDPDPSGYGGNGQFEKGYEDGYDDY